MLSAWINLIMINFSEIKTSHFHFVSQEYVSWFKNIQISLYKQDLLGFNLWKDPQKPWYECVCVCVCGVCVVCVWGVCGVCVCVCVHVYVVYEDTNLYNDMGMT